MTSNLNENEAKALAAIMATCEDIEGEHFTRLADAVYALADVFGDGSTAGECFASLERQGIIETDEDAYGVGIWVNID